MNRIIFSSNKMDWETPKEFFQELDKEFHFTLDPCCVKKTAKCKKYFTPKTNGLKQSWAGEIVFCNPPYGREISAWVKKAYDEAKGGATVVMLLPSRTGTSWWWNYCMKGKIRFIKGRLKFRGKNSDGKYVNQNATFDNALVIFKPKYKKGTNQLELSL